MANLILSNLTRTISTYFRIGTIRIKDSSAVLQARNAGDTAFIDVAGKQIRIQGNNATNAIILNSPNGLGASVTYTLPGTDGSTGQVLSTNGSGTLSWASVSANADLTQVEAFTEATSSPLTIFTPPANAIIRLVIIEVTAAAAGGTPTVKAGTALDDDAYMLVTENDLLETGVYEVQPLVSAGGSPSAVILTITPDSQTFSGNVYVVYTNPS